MARYVQSSTANPYGHTPWQTALYTTFGDFAWLKQPQNAIVREPAGIAPRIRKPPELAGVTIVGGSGRVLGTLGSQMRLGLDMTPAEASRFSGIWRMAGGTPFQIVPSTPDRVTIVKPTTPVAVSAPVNVSPVSQLRVASVDSYVTTPAPAPTPVTTASGAVSTYTPGAPGPAGSPFSAPAASGPPPAPTIAIAPAPGLLDQVKAWLADSMIAGIPNYWLAIGGGLLLAGSSSRKGGRF